MMTLGIQRLFRLLAGRSKRHIFLVVLGSAAGGVCSVTFVSMLQMAAAGRAPRGSFELWPLLVTLAIAAPAIRVSAQILLVKLAEGTVSDLLVRLCERVLATSLSHLERIGAHRIESALTSDIVAVTAGLMSLPVLVLNSVVLIGCFIWIALISPLALVWIAALCSLGVTASWVGSRRGTRHLMLARKHLNTIYSHWRALTLGTKELKLHAGRRREFIADMVQGDVKAYRRHSFNARSTFALGLGGAQLNFFSLLVVIAIVLPRAAGTDRATVASLIVTLFFMLGFLEGLMIAIPEILRATVALDNLESLDLKLAAADARETLAAPSVGPASGHAAPGDRRAAWRLEFANVTHAYHRDGDSASFEVGPISFTLAPGELVFVVGGNGAGKTTFAKLLTGLYAPNGGAVLFNGERIDDENREAYRQRFAAVFSDCYVFQRLLGIDDAVIEREGRQQLTRLGLDAKVSIVNRAFTQTNLSRGQVKRLALLTACLEDREIYVFDEWAADQDPSFKHVFYRQILQSLKARAKGVVVITHDETYFDVADRMITLMDGRMAPVRAYRSHAVSLEALLDEQSHAVLASPQDRPSS